MAFKPHTEWVSTAGDLHWLPREPTFANFEYIFTGETDAYSITHERTATKPILSSLITALLGTAIAVIAGTLGAYAVSRFGVGQKPAARRPPASPVPAAGGDDPGDDHVGLHRCHGFLVGALAHLRHRHAPLAFWLMKTFFDEVPREIEEAALVEGCSWFRVFWKITLPMVKAALASTTLFVFILNWSDYVMALLLTRKEWVTIPVYMNSAVLGDDGADVRRQARRSGLIAVVPRWSSASRSRSIWCAASPSGR